MKIGCLYIVATPIGNYQDITLRALQVLREADAVICEEFRQGSTLLKKLDIPAKELLQLNEHNEKEKAPELLQLMLSGKKLALVSDCGTPAFADPGTYLVKLAGEFQVPVIPVPGVSSLMTLISVSPLSMDRFHFAGFLPRKTDQRQSELKALLAMNVPIILMDTPYRLEKLLLEVRQSFGKNRLITLALDLTLESEKILHGTINEILPQIKNRKSEFMLIVY
jgi:16S rRNA (cytidine1402-2'-O)-methyltransferase